MTNGGVVTTTSETSKSERDWGNDLDEPDGQGGIDHVVRKDWVRDIKGRMCAVCLTQEEADSIIEFIKHRVRR